MKRRTLWKRWSTALVLPILVGAGCSSQSELDRIIASNLEARGGIEKIKSLQSIRFSGSARAGGGRIARVVREVKRPGMYRLEFSSQGMTSIFACDGTVSWEVAPLRGLVEPRITGGDDGPSVGIDQLDIEGPLVDWRDKGHRVELVGRDALPGGDAYKLQLNLADGSVRYDYIDVETHLVVRSDVTRMIGDEPILLENDFSDFRETDGLVFPYRVETRAPDRPETVTITVETVELNPDLDDALFRFPGAD